MVAVDSVDVLFHRLVALCLAENNDQRYNSVVHIVIVLCFSFMSLRHPLMWKQNLYLFLLLCVHVCARVNMKVWAHSWESEWWRDRMGERLWESLDRSVSGENLSSSILHTLICQHIPTLKSTSSPTAEHISLCCCTLPIFKLYENVCLRCYPKDNTLLLVWHSKDRGWHTPEKNQLTGNLDIMKSSDFIPNAT